MQYPPVVFDHQRAYWSKTRVYSPALREWLSPDPLVKWNPKALVDKPGNWHSVRYASGRPMEYVDPAGSDILIAALILGGTKAATIGLGYLGLKASQKMHNTPPTVATKQNQGMNNAAKIMAVMGAGQVAVVGAAVAAPAAVKVAESVTVATATNPNLAKKGSAFIKGAFNELTSNLPSDMSIANDPSDDLLDQRLGELGAWTARSLKGLLEHNKKESSIGIPQENQLQPRVGTSP